MTRWLTVEVCGRDLAVNLYPKLNLYGQHRPDKGEIAIRHVTCEGTIYDTLLHEVLIHAIFEGTGLRRECTEKLGLTDDEWMEIEECIAHIWTPAALSAMRRAGWLHLPEIPDRG